MSANTIIDYTVFLPIGSNADQLCKQYIEDLSSDLEEYIWHKEEFGLEVSDNLKPSEHPSLCGSTNVGENINDEWFIVYLLMKISKKYTDIIIQVTDTDENFLLIEAADYLPKWLKPDKNENRVFLHNHHLHIIPFPSNPSEVTCYPAGVPSISKAYQIVTNRSINTQANQEVQNCITERIKDYPDRIKRDFHHAHCFLPTEIVYILHHHPQSMAAAVEAFYNRDHLDIKICRNLPSFSPANQMLSRVKFTKHLYCQLSQARFLPDRKTKWVLPLPNDPSYNAKELGYKLACGFEILLSNYKSTKEDGEPYGKKWQSYLENLKKNDFFQGELEGSRKYQELLRNAKLHFKEHVYQSLDPYGQRLVKLYAESANHKDEMEKWSEKIEPEDDDSWMTVSPEELDQMMLGVWKNYQSNQQSENQGSSDNLSRLVDNMKLFVDKVSTYEGVEAPDDVAESKGVDEKINFDPKAFMQNITDLLSPPKTFDDHQEDEMFSDSDEDVDDDFVSCKPGVKEMDDSGLHDVMQSMDDELKKSSISQSFKDGVDASSSNEGLDCDINLLKNFLESFQSQDGLSGPVSNILHSMGMNLPPNLDEGGMTSLPYTNEDT